MSSSDRSRPLGPPTPIPTGKGLRSAVDSVLSEHIDRTQVVPELSLPQKVQHWVPAKIDYRSLKSKEKQAIEAVSRSISDGVFLINELEGFSTEKLRSILADNEWVFALLSADHDGLCHGYDEKCVWSISHNKLMLEKCKYFADKERIFQILSQEMENISTKLEEISQEFNQVINIGSVSAQHLTELKSNETKLYIYRSIYNIKKCSTITEQNQEKLISPNSSNNYIFSLFLPLESANFYLKTKQTSFWTNPNTLIVTIGNNIEMINSSLIVKHNNIHGNQVLLSIELHCSNYFSSSISQNNNNNNGDDNNKISLVDHIVIVIIFVLLYKFIHYVIS